MNKYFSLSLISLFLTACGGSSSDSGSVGTLPSDVQVTSALSQTRITNLADMNAFRATAGSGALQIDSSAQDVAQEYAQTIAHTEVLTHDGFSTRIANIQSKLGVTVLANGENLAYINAWDGSEFATNWYNSPVHQANMLNANFTHVGLGFAQNKTSLKVYGVQIFIKK